MRFKKFLLIFCAILLVGGALSLFLAPFVVATGLRLWIAHTSRQDGLRIEFGKIEAPLLRPVVVHDLKITSQPEAPFRVRIESPNVELALNLSALLSRSRGHFLRALTTDGLTVDIRPNPHPTSQRFAWRTFNDLLADNFKLSGVTLHLENGETIIDLQDGTLSGAQIEAGVFAANEVTIVSPLFCKSFANLRGATSWQENRLSIGALTLTRGLDLDAISIDLSHIGENRIGLELSMDAFGGKVRASISSDDHADKRTWDVAGSVSEVSLAQMSDALDFTERAGGSLHACKFTFRGDTKDLPQATATIWAEVTGFTWADRTADTIIIGASLYNRQVQVEQVFVKQLNNQLTLTGESALPEKLSDWLNPDFRGDISASINDLGEFARLFGARPSGFAGKIDISGNVNTLKRKLGGQLTISGKSLVLFRTPVESLDVKLGVRESQLEISNFELCRKSDYFRGQANVDLRGGRSYSGTFTSSIAEAAEYADLMPEVLRAFPFGGRLNLDWSGKGVETAHSGAFHVRGQRLHPLDSSAIPFEADLEGDYSPGGIFFREFNLSNPNATFRTFLTLSKDYLQLQTLRFDLNGQPKLQGNIFLPISLSKLSEWADWPAALSGNPIFDLDVTLDPTDLAELARAVSTQPKMSGQASGSLKVHGPATTLEGKSMLHLRDFVFGNESRLSVDAEIQTALGTINGKATAVARGSDPVNLEASLPFKLEKQDPGFVLNTEGASSAMLNFPAVFLAKLPQYISRWMFVDGILSGRLTVSDFASHHPQVRGMAHLINGRLLGGAALSTGVTFAGQTATIDFAQVAYGNVRSVHPLPATGFTARGEIDFRDSTNIKMRLFPNEAVTALTRLEPDDCVNGIDLSPTIAGGTQRQRIDEVGFRGGLFTPGWTISLSEKKQADPLEALLRADSSRTFPVCPGPQPSGKTLMLGVNRLTFP